MPKYTVKGTTILHNGTAYGEGNIVEMTEKQAKRLSKFLTPVKESQPKQAVQKANTGTSKAKTAAKTPAADTKDGSQQGQDAAANDKGGSTDDK